MVAFNIVGSDQLSSALRWDAEFFVNSYSSYLDDVFRRWSDWEPLSKVAAKKITSGHTPRRHDVEIGDTPFITVECVNPLALDLAKTKRVWARHLAGELSRVKVSKGDVLTTIKRRIGISYPVLRDHGPIAVNQDVALITPKPAFRTGYLASVLNSRIGQYQALRYATEQMNPYINVQTLSQILIPVVHDDTQKLIEQSASDRITALEAASALYRQAENALLSALDYVPPARSEPVAYEEDIQRILTVGRADAEFFQPWVVDLKARLGSQGRALSDVASLQQNIFRKQAKETFTYIEIGDVSANTLVTGTVVPTSDAPSRAKWLVRPGDVITSTVRPLRRLTGIISDEQDGWVCSSGFAVLKPVKIPSEYLALYMRLEPFTLLMDAYTTSSMYPAISTDDLMGLPFYMPEDTSLVDHCCKLVKQARQECLKADAALKKTLELVEATIA